MNINDELVSKFGIYLKTLRQALEYLKLHHKNPEKIYEESNYQKLHLFCLDNYNAKDYILGYDSDEKDIDKMIKKWKEDFPNSKENPSYLKMSKINF